MWPYAAVPTTPCPDLDSAGCGRLSGYYSGPPVPGHLFSKPNEEPRERTFVRSSRESIWSLASGPSVLPLLGQVNLGLQSLKTGKQVRFQTFI
jgi:hypothetical protein